MVRLLGTGCVHVWSGRLRRQLWFLPPACASQPSRRRLARLVLGREFLPIPVPGKSLVSGYWILSEGFPLR